MSGAINNKLKAETLRVLDERGWSRRGAMIATGINYSIIQQMAQGIAPSVSKIVEWADAIGEDSAEWLGYAGFTVVDGRIYVERPRTSIGVMPITRRGEDEPAAFSPTPEPEAAPELTREPFLDDEEQRIVTLYTGLPEGERETVRRLLESLAEKYRGKEEE